MPKPWEARGPGALLRGEVWGIEEAGETLVNHLTSPGRCSLIKRGALPPALCSGLAEIRWKPGVGFHPRDTYQVPREEAEQGSDLGRPWGQPHAQDGVTREKWDSVSSECNR